MTLSARREAGDVVLAVTDNGCGLPAEDCERVFEMFVQLPAGDRSHGGLGIGLAPARNLIRRCFSGGPRCSR